MELHDYNFEYDPKVSFKDQNVKKEAVALVASFKLQYWSNEEEKQKLEAQLNEAKQRHAQEKINKTAKKS